MSRVGAASVLLILALGVPVVTATEESSSKGVKAFHIDAGAEIGEVVKKPLSRREKKDTHHMMSTKAVHADSEKKKKRIARKSRRVEAMKMNADASMQKLSADSGLDRDDGTAFSPSMRKTFAVREAMHVLERLRQQHTQGLKVDEQHKGRRSGTKLFGIFAKVKSALEALVSDETADILQEGANNVADMTEEAVGDVQDAVNESVHNVVAVAKEEKEEILAHAEMVVDALTDDIKHEFDKLKEQAKEYVDKYKEDVVNVLSTELGEAVDEGLQCLAKTFNQGECDAIHACTYKPNGCAFGITCCGLSAEYVANATAAIRIVLDEGHEYVADLKDMANASAQSILEYAIGNGTAIAETGEESLADVQEAIHAETEALADTVNNTVNVLIGQIKKIIDDTVNELKEEAFSAEEEEEKVVEAEETVILEEEEAAMEETEAELAN